MKSKNLMTGLIVLIMAFTSTGNSPELKKEVPVKEETSEAVILASQPAGLPLEKSYIKRNLEHYSGFGYRMHPVHRKRLHHQGIDLPAPTGTPARSTSYGTVKAVIHKRTGYGKHVIVRSGSFDILYGHLSEIKVREGDRVTTGDTLGLVGSTGTSTAPHLHYEVRLEGKAVNPIEYM